MPNPSNRFPGWNLAAAPAGPSSWGPSATDNATWSPEYCSGAGAFGPAAPVQPVSARTHSAVQSAVVQSDTAIQTNTIQDNALQDNTVPTVVQLDDAAEVVVSLPAAIANDEQVLAALQEAARRIAVRLAERRRQAA